MSSLRQKIERLGSPARSDTGLSPRERPVSNNVLLFVAGLGLPCCSIRTTFANSRTCPGAPSWSRTSLRSSCASIRPSKGNGRRSPNASHVLGQLKKLSFVMLLCWATRAIAGPLITLDKEAGSPCWNQEACGRDLYCADIHFNHPGHCEPRNPQTYYPRKLYEQEEETRRHRGKPCVTDFECPGGLVCVEKDEFGSGRCL